MYRALHLFVRFILRQFFTEVRLSGASPIETGPVIILGNHPNMALDSLVIASVYERELWFLGKATLFRNPLVATVLDKLHVIPVERRQWRPLVGDMGHPTGRPICPRSPR